MFRKLVFEEVGTRAVVLLKLKPKLSPDNLEEAEKRLQKVKAEQGASSALYVKRFLNPEHPDSDPRVTVAKRLSLAKAVLADGSAGSLLLPNCLLSWPSVAQSTCCAHSCQLLDCTTV